MQSPRFLCDGDRFYIDWYTQSDEIKEFKIALNVSNFKKQYPRINYRRQNVLYMGKRKNAPEIQWERKGGIDLFVLGGDPQDEICYVKFYNNASKKEVDCIFVLEDGSDVKDYVCLEAEG